jgi:peptidoglycan/xylan/chitin deacetylase (PgdA/CDA1 family)
LLEQYQARGTYYISGGGCGSTSLGVRLATRDEVKGLCSGGHEVGCHTYSHAAVSDLGSTALVAELDRNRSFLQGLDRHMVVRNFAYPYGDLSFRAKHYLEARFDTCRSILPGVNFGTTDLGALKAYELQNASTDRQGIREIIGETVRRNGWLVFTSHDVDEKPSRFGVSPDLLEFALQAAHDAGCQIAAIRDALRIVSGTGAPPAASSFSHVAG